MGIDSLNTRYQLLCAHGNVVFLLCFFIGFGALQRYIPPPSPNVSAADIAALYRDNPLSQRLGALITMIGCAFIVPFAAVISVQMKRIEGSFPVLAYTQFGSNVLSVLLFYIPCLAWITAAFRPERDPQLILLINDFAWFAFMLPFMCLFVQFIAVGLAILGDKRAEPIFPRWLGFANFWGALILITGGLVPFFKTGPAAWNGLFTFWLGGVPYFGFYSLMYIYVIKAIKRQAQSERIDMVANPLPQTS